MIKKNEVSGMCYRRRLPGDKVETWASLRPDSLNVSILSFWWVSWAERASSSSRWRERDSFALLLSFLSLFPLSLSASVSLFGYSVTADDENHFLGLTTMMDWQRDATFQKGRKLRHIWRISGPFNAKRSLDGWRSKDNIWINEWIKQKLIQ